QHAHGADRKTLALDPLPIFDPRELGASAAHIDIQIAILLLEILRPEGLYDQIRLQLSIDRFDLYAAFALRPFDHLIAIGSFAHGAGGAATHAFHAIDFGDQAEAGECLDEHAGLRFADLAPIEHILAEADGHADQHLLLHHGMIGAFDHFGNKQPHGVGTDVDRGVFQVTVDGVKLMR